MEAEEKRNFGKFPRYGWKVKLDHEFAESRNQNLRPAIRQVVPQLVPLALRYLFWWTAKVKNGKKPVIDQFRPRHSKAIYGAPCGGLGSGTIGRGFRGEFCRFQMVPGMYDYHCVAADQFILTVHDSRGDCVYQSVLGGHGRPAGAPSSWEWRGKPEDGLYCALYPRAWTVYNIPEVRLRVVCRQVSPFMPHNYKDSCLPAAVFVFTVENNSERKLQVSITLTFKNGTGAKSDKNGGDWTEPFAEENCSGVLIQQAVRGHPLNYCLAAETGGSCSTSWCTAWDPSGSGDEVWAPLHSAGRLDSSTSTTQKTERGQEVAAAVSGRVDLEPRSRGTVRLCLAWDQPTVAFRDKEKTHLRFYTKWFGSNGNAASSIASYALSNVDTWEKMIEEWQEPILSDVRLPDWFKSAIFNELYFLADGGSVWLLIDPGEGLSEDDPRHEFGRWGYLESHEYRMYNTYDVHFYASWALAELFPGLELSLQLDVLDWSDREDRQQVVELYGGTRSNRKVSNSVPHDLGDPEEEPWVKINSYSIHNVAQWRDLNLKLVIMVWRDYKLLGTHIGEASKGWLLNRAIPTCTKLMEKALTWDTDNDGVIENSGRPDQTFDSWVMSGPSAYCGGLWVSALACFADMLSEVGDSKAAELWRGRQVTATDAYINKLWNGEFFKFDASPRGEQVIMADQLAGHWYRRLNGAYLLPPDKVKKCLFTIYNYNVMKFCEGRLGAVNGMMVSGDVDRSTVQSEEVWTGVTYGLAALMLAEGLQEEGFKTAEGVYKTVYETIGLGFETPEALYEKNHYRAIGYMRPLSIWSMYVAWTLSKSEKEPKL